MTTPEMSTAVAAPATPVASGVDELLRELRQSEEMPKTTKGMQLLLRIEQALIEASSRSVVGASQITDYAKMKAYIDFGTFVSQGSVTLPDHLKGNAADCTAIAMRSDRWGLDFYGVAEKTHVVQGKLGYEGQLIGAILKNMGAIKEEALHDEYFGPWEKILGKFIQRESKTKKDSHGHPVTYMVPGWKPEDEAGLGIRVWGTLPGETEPRQLEVLMSQALVRNSTLWAGNPKQQIFYLAEKLWARKYAPGALLGVYTVDELEASAPRDMGDADVVERPGGAGPARLQEVDLKAWRAASEKGTQAARAHWAGMGQQLRKLATQTQMKQMWDIATEADKQRTVDNAPPPADAAAAAAVGEPGATASSADPETGEVDDDFVAAMNAAEQAQQQGPK